MSETMLGTIVGIGMLIIVIGCWFYMLGGRANKFLRRFIGSFICSTAIWVTSLLLGVFSFSQLLVYPLLAFVFCLGYGADITLTKIIRRTIVVLCSLLTGLLFCITVGGMAWIVLPLQLLIAAGSIWLGVKNPVPAAVEEFFVCLLLTQCILLYPFVSVVL